MFQFQNSMILSLFSEAMPFLRSTFGTVIVSILIFITYMTGALVPNSIFTKIISFSGDNYLIRAINQASINAIGEPLKGSFLLLAGNTNEKATGTKALIFPTISFSAQDKLALICQLGLLILLILLTVLVFSPHRYQNKSMLKVKRFSDRAVPPIVAKEKLHPIEGHSANIWQLLRLSFVQLSSSVSTYVKLALLILWLLSFVLPKTIDPMERVIIRNVLSELASTRIVLLSTHIISDIEAVASKLIVLKSGRIKYQGSADGLLDEVKDYVWEYVLPTGENPEQLANVSSIVQAVDGIHVRVVSKSVPNPQAKNVQPRLEDASLAILEGGEIN